MRKFIKENYLLFLVIFIALFFRLLLLNKFPISMSDDEIREVMSAYSFIHTGKDVYGMSYPFSFNLDGWVYAPIPVYIVSVFVGLFGLSVGADRLPYALAGVASIAGVYFLSLQLIKNKKVAFLSSLTLSISVWHLQVSRFAHQGIFSLCFMIFGTYFLIKTQKKKWLNLIISMFFFFLAFYSYAAIKVIVLPAILIIIAYKWKSFTRKQLLLISLSIFVIFFSFFILNKFQNAAQYQTGQFFFMDNGKTAKDVELQRRASRESFPLLQIYHNKFTYWSRIFWNNYLYAFSPQYLFMQQEGSGIYSMWDRGQLYLIELPLMLLGAFFLFVKRRKEMFLLGGLLLIAPLASGIGPSDPTYAERSIFMLPILYIFIGTGIYSIKFISLKKSITYLIYSLLLLAYVYSFIGYLGDYYYDWSFYHSTYYSKTTKDMILFAIQNREKFDKIIIAGASDNTILHYTFYSRLDAREMQKILNMKVYKYENIEFLDKCLNNGIGDPRSFLNKNTLYIAPDNCYKNTKKDAVIKTQDGAQVMWNIFKK